MKAKQMKHKCKVCGKETDMPFHTCDRSTLAKKWKKHGEVRLNPDKSIDEIYIEKCDLHIEQMSDGNWWIGVYAGPRTGIKPKYGKRRNRKDMMHIRLFHKQDKPVHVNCETDDGLITEGFFPK
jgi:hypothetical protein